MDKRPLKVFLCHASADKPKVRELYRTLKRRGVQPWLDAEDLIPGQNWEVDFCKAVRDTDRLNNNRTGYVLPPDYHPASYFTVIVKGPWTSSFKAFSIQRFKLAFSDSGRLSTAPAKQ